MNAENPKIPAIMNVDSGEEIAGMWVTPHVSGTGIYKLLAKKRKDNKYEWAHFVQRDNNMKDSIYRGETDTKEQLDMVLDIINKNLANVFGQQIQLRIAQYDVYTVDGIKADNQPN